MIFILVYTLIQLNLSFIIPKNSDIIKGMNYGRAYVKEYNSPKSKDRRSTKRKFILSLTKTLLILILVVIAVIIGGFIYYAKSQIDDLPDISQVNVNPSGKDTRVVDAKGREIATLSVEDADEDHVSIDEIPENLQHAIVATEDSRFYEHNGVDVRGIIRAAFQGLVNGGHFSEGGSTITQQVLKNNYFSSWPAVRTFSSRIRRKIQEQYLAIQLEKTMTKDQILENYLNTISLGENTLGVEAASERYFNKRVSALSLSECAVIAAAAQNPTKYNPAEHPRNNAIRREKVLDSMLDQGYITTDQYKDAMDDSVYRRVSKTENDFNGTSYFVEAMTDQVVNDLISRQGLSETEAYMKLYTGGLTIHSTQDSRVQTIAEHEVNDQDNYPTNPKYSFTFNLTVIRDGVTRNYSQKTMLDYYKKNDLGSSINFSTRKEAEAAYDAYRNEVAKGGMIPSGGENVTYTLEPQAAMTIIDQRTGRVRAIVGGRQEKMDERAMNRACDITRQPGATFKILSTFAPALDAGGLTLASVEDDAPMTDQTGERIRNYDGRYRGLTTIREAITDSINIVSIKTLTEIGTGLGYQYVKDFGISTLKEGDNNQYLALGNITSGVKNYELAAAYATIANGGVYQRPVFYTTVEDSHGRKILDTTRREGKRVIEKTTAWLLTSAMQDAMKKGNGRKAAFTDMPVAGMTGITDNNTDAVFAGYTPYYTCAIWGGNDDGTSQSTISYAKNIWKSVMLQINSGKEQQEFMIPADIIETHVCRKSGKLPEEGVCDQDPRGSMVYSEFFEEGTEPTESCDHHIRLTICKDSGLPATEYCPSTEEKVFITGGSKDTDDGKYLVDPKILNKTCNIHTGPLD